jgi:type II restriction enzyme
MNDLILSYINDPEAVYQTWFLNNDDRLKAFRSIRKSLLKVISEMESGTFGNDFKGSSLETVISAISEQKQIFEGAAHAETQIAYS